MKKSDLKQLIKPLVKECIHETLIEEGLLASVVAEVATGLQRAPLLESTKRPITPEPEFNSKNDQEANARMNEYRQSQRHNLMESINKDSYNGVDLFEGTSAFNSYEAEEPKPGSVELGNPRDAGVDISAIAGNASKLWQAMK